MEEQLISKDTAMLAKQKGFMENTAHWYNESEGEQDVRVSAPMCHNKYSGIIAAPPQALLQRWLREVKHIHIIIVIYNFGADEYAWELYDLYQEKHIKESFMGAGSSYGGTFNTYEQALEAGLVMALTLI